MLARTLLAAVVVLLFALPARGQIVYQPVRYQYFDGAGHPFFYGGHDPAVFRQAFIPGWLVRTHVAPLAVYTDTLPGLNAQLYGFTPNDAANEAFANLPRYFRKADIYAAAAQVHGELDVPAWAPTAADPPPPGGAAATASIRITPSGPHPLMIIPMPRSQPQQRSATSLVLYVPTGR